MKTLNGKEITKELLDSFEANNFFGDSDESEEIRDAWERLVFHHPQEDISDNLATELLGEAIERISHKKRNLG